MVNYSLRLVLTIGLLFSTMRIVALEPKLVRDIPPITGSSSPEAFAEYNGAVYFFADDGVHGRALWLTDGTEAGTRMICDLDSGPASVYTNSPSTFLCNGRLCFYMARDGHGVELWSTDGTASGTRILNEIMPDTDISEIRPRYLGTIGNQSYILAGDKLPAYESYYGDNNLGGELWVTDGTIDGTWQVLSSQSLWLDPDSIFRLQAQTFFIISLVDGTRLYRMNDSESVDRISDWETNNHIGIKVLNGYYYFIINNELWKTNGKAGGTSKVASPNDFGEYMTNSIVWRNHLIFDKVDYYDDGDKTSYYSVIYQTDGTADGTIKLFPEIGHYPYHDEIINSLLTDDERLYFCIGDVYVMSEPGSTPVKITQKTHNDYRNLFSIGRKVHFLARVYTDRIDYDELWTTQGTLESSVSIKSFPGQVRSVLNQPGSDVAYFLLRNKEQHCDELWRSDGTEFGTVYVKTITHEIPEDDLRNNRMLRAGDKLYYSFYDKLIGAEPVVTDLAGDNDDILKDLNSRTWSSTPRDLQVADELLFFNTNDLLAKPGVENPYALWRTDGTESGTVVFYPPASNSNWPYEHDLIQYTEGRYLSRHKYVTATSNYFYFWQNDGMQIKNTYNRPIYHPDGPHTVAGMNGIFYFSADDHFLDFEVWRSDGTETGTWRVKDICPGSQASMPEYLTSIGGRLYFRANDGTNGNELWCSDGTSTGTLMVKNINQGSTNSYPRNFTTASDAIFFSAFDAVCGRELWRTDGTEPGTVRVKDIIPGTSGAEPKELTALGRRLLFTARNGTGGSRSLWSSDGTEAGTIRIQQFSTDGPTSLTRVGEVVVFIATDTEHGAELWRSDGTPIGTFLAADLNPGPTSSAPEEFTPGGNGRLYFRTSSPPALWSFDTRSGRAVRLSDESWPVALPAGKCAELTWFKGRLYFVGDSPQIGRELWLLPFNAALPQRAWDFYY